MSSAQEDKEHYDGNSQAKAALALGGVEMSTDEMREKRRKAAELQFKKMLPYINLSDSILEIGSGYGVLMEHMEKQGFSVTGIEISNSRRKMAQSFCQGEILDTNLLLVLPLELEKKFNVVYMFHVLEHISSTRILKKKHSKGVETTGAAFTGSTEFRRPHETTQQGI